MATKKKSVCRRMSRELPKKRCPVCGVEKTIAKGFYKSNSPLYAEDGCVPICIECVKNGILNEDETISISNLRSICRKIDKPLYYEALDSAYSQYRREHSFITDEELAHCGKDIVGYYFKNIASLKQYKNKDFEASEKDKFILPNTNLSKRAISDMVKRYTGEISNSSPVMGDTPFKQPESIGVGDINQYKPTDEDIQLFGEGFSFSEYRKMRKKYENLKLNYSLQTNLHQEALATYVRFKVKEEDATARGDVDEAKKWYDAAQNAASNGKLTPKQMSESDLQGGINSFSEIFKAVEQAVDVIPILPRFKYRPNDALDFNIWCYINYARDLKGLPQCEYEDVYKFYDKKKQEYLDQYGDPYGIFDSEPDDTIRENIKRFISLPNDYDSKAE